MKRWLRFSECRVEMQRLRIHGERCEQHVICLSGGATRPVQVSRTLHKFLEIEPPLFDDLWGFVTRCRHLRFPHSPSDLAMSMSCISLVPSPISSILESR